MPKLVSIDIDIDHYGELVYKDNFLHLRTRINSEKLYKLESFSNLQSINIEIEGNLCSMEWLSSIPRIEKIIIKCNCCLDFSTVSINSNLKYLKCQTNTVFLEKFLKNQKQLRYLYVLSQSIDTIEGINNCTKIKSFYLSKGDPYYYRKDSCIHWCDPDPNNCQLNNRCKDTISLLGLDSRLKLEHVYIDNYNITDCHVFPLWITLCH